VPGGGRIEMNSDEPKVMVIVVVMIEFNGGFLCS
jgi:hypothetical protein